MPTQRHKNTPLIYYMRFCYPVERIGNPATHRPERQQRQQRISQQTAGENRQNQQSRFSKPSFKKNGAWGQPTPDHQESDSPPLFCLDHRARAS
jgi:hypothetical protein